MRLFWIVALSPLILTAQARFHHVALNVTDPRAAIDFFNRRFDCEPAKLAATELAVWTPKSWNSQRAITLEGPDHLAIQLVKGHLKKE